MLKAEGNITDVVIENMMHWHHSGFNVYYGKAIWPHNEEGLENLARYIIQASLPAHASQWQAGFSQERMRYVGQQLMSGHNSQFTIDPLRKSNFLSLNTMKSFY